MLHKEFEELIGRKATESEYEMADAIYMGCGDSIDKQTFCAEYVKLQDNPLFKSVFKAWNEEIEAKAFEANRAAELEMDLESQKEVTDKLRKDLGAFLVDRAEHFHSGTLRDKAIELIGLRAYLKAKIERGDNLWRRDFLALIGEVNGGMQNVLETLSEPVEQPTE